MNATPLTATERFDRQVDTLIELGYPAIAGMTPGAFTQLLQPLRRKLETLGPLPPGPEGHVPFVIVCRRSLAPVEATMPLTRLGNHAGFIDFKPGGLETFEPLARLAAPEAPAYLVCDLDTGSDLRNLPPDAALEVLSERGRTPLTIEEGIALVTHHPERLVKNHCFSLAGSRSGDRRVPALWISERRPKLGWCWAGNPHTWLGTASCGGRLSSGS